jgi:dinuclear metal center YbgI/SA1388 family protein
MKVMDIEHIMEQWAPRWTAWERDNVGLQIGDRTRRVKRILVSLDVTPKIVAEAVRKKAEMIVAHHPLLFRPPSAILSSDTTGSMILDLAKHDIAVYAAHTNLDAVKDGVSFALAGALKLKNVRFLAPLKDLYAKIAVFVPSSHVENVMKAMAGAGAGQIGEYSHCSFQMNGRGTFRGTQKTKPYAGRAGVLEEVGETRLEMILPRFQTASVITAMKEAHPYEEVAYDLYPLSNESPQYGMGAIGELAAPLALSSFLKTVKRALDCEGLRFTGKPANIVRTVAVCGGAGSELLKEALRARADVFVTADVRYHAFHEAEGRIALVDAGHWETEQVVLPAIAARLRGHAPKGKEEISVFITNQRTNPIHSI